MINPQRYPSCLRIRFGYLLGLYWNGMRYWCYVRQGPGSSQYWERERERANESVTIPAYNSPAEQITQAPRIQLLYGQCILLCCPLQLSICRGLEKLVFLLGDYHMLAWTEYRGNHIHAYHMISLSIETQSV